MGAVSMAAPQPPLQGVPFLSTPLEKLGIVIQCYWHWAGTSTDSLLLHQIVSVDQLSADKVKRKVNLSPGTGAIDTLAAEVPSRAWQLPDRPERLLPNSRERFGGEDSPSPCLGEDMEPPGPQFHLTGNPHWAQRELLLMFALVLF